MSMPMHIYNAIQFSAAAAPKIYAVELKINGTLLIIRDHMPDKGEFGKINLTNYLSLLSVRSNYILERWLL